jgi:hypothetical protein
MSPALIFNLHLGLGYVPWLIGFSLYAWPRLKGMPTAEAQRLIALLHSFRFFGLVFILPGVVGTGLPANFAAFAAYGDFATGLLAIAALLTARAAALFRGFVAAFNLVGAADILIDYYHGARIGIAALSGQLGAAYAIVILYVPLLMITHGAALWLLVGRGSKSPGTAG